MKIKNISNSNIMIPEIKTSQGSGLSLSPGAEVEIYDEDAEKSSSLATYIADGLISKTGSSEPLDSSGAADTAVAATATTVSALLLTVASLQSDLALAQGDIASLQGDLSSAQGDISSLQGEVIDLTQRVLDLEASN